jgi:hypothetical protein
MYSRALSLAFILTALIIASPNTYAAYDKTEYVKVTNAWKSSVSTNGSTWRLEALMKTTGANLPAVYNNVKMPVSAATAVRAARFAIGGPLSAALLTASLLDDLIFVKDEATDEWIYAHPANTFPPSGAPCGSSGGTNCQSWKNTLGVPNTCTVTSGGTIQMFASYTYPSAQVGNYASYSPAPIVIGNCGGLSSGVNFAMARYGQIPVGTDYEELPTPATEAEVMANLHDHVDEDLMRQVLNDFLTKAKQLHDQTDQALQDAADEIKDAQNRALNNDTSVPTDIDIVVNNKTEAPAEALKIPTNCDLLPILCQIFDWLKAEDALDDHPDLPVEDIEPETYSSGLGAGSCPAAVPFTLQGQQMQFSYQIACDAAPWFKAILLIIASIAAAYILLGVRSNA